jgi:uncharacterized membrane protein YphA (DoxX/SURF4 family)
MFRSLIATSAPGWTILIRLSAGAVFLSEGIQKYLFPDTIGAGRFSKIGIPSPEVMGPFVGGVEIVCGALVLAGLFTRLAAVPLIVIMAVAIFTTKIPMLTQKGFWFMAHESRTDFAMILSCVFLALVGAGRWSLDGLIRARKPDV